MDFVSIERCYVILIGDLNLQAWTQKSLFSCSLYIMRIDDHRKQENDQRNRRV